MSNVQKEVSLCETALEEESDPVRVLLDSWSGFISGSAVVPVVDQGEQKHRSPSLACSSVPEPVTCCLSKQPCVSANGAETKHFRR